MDFKVEVTRTAHNDLSRAVAYLAGVLQSPQAARTLLLKFQVCTERLEHMPASLPLCTDAHLAARGYHKMRCKDYLLLFRIEQGTVYVMHLFHQTQNYAALV